MSDHIPREVLIDILARLTVEDLVRCTGVRKSWYSLVTSTDFVSFHMKQQLAAAATTSPRNNNLLLVRGCTEELESDAPDREQYSIRSHENNHRFALYKTLDSPLESCNPYWNPYFRVIGCCNGVVCLSDDLINIMDDIILWNPSIKKSVALPSSPVTYNSHGLLKHSIGFGLNAATNDFKVVRVVYLRGDDCWYDTPPMVEVYDLSEEGSWTSVDPKGFPYVIPDRTSQVFLNNAVHWVGHNRVKVDGGESLYMIVSFDLRTDVFGAIKFPHSVADQGYRGGFSVSTCGESLALIQTMFSENYQKICCVWVMKQYGVADSWTKLFSFDLTGDLWKVCGLLKNEEEALVIVDQSENPYSYPRKEALASYEPKSKRRNRIGEIRSRRSVFVDYFVETLALLRVKRESVKQADSDNTVVSKKSIPKVHAGKEEED